MHLNAMAAACVAATIGSTSPAAAQESSDPGSCCEYGMENWPEDPNTTRLVLGPTARPLPKGSVSLGIHGFVLPSVQVGITDRVSIGGGTPLMFPLTTERPFWITPKIALVDRPGTQVAIGAVQTMNLNGAGVAYAVTTTGTTRRSITAGAGVAYSRGGGRSLVLMLGGDRQVRRRMKLVTENYYFSGSGVLSAGVRFFDQRKSLDVALAAPINSYFYGVEPTLSFVYRF
jgi:hypothetical protein